MSSMHFLVPVVFHCISLYSNMCMYSHSMALSLCLPLQWMAAGESGVSGQRVVRTARGSAAESVRLRSPSMGGDCVTGWQWLQKTAQAASVHRVGNISSTLHWLKRRKRYSGLAPLLLVPLCSLTVSS